MGGGAYLVVSRAVFRLIVIGALAASALLLEGVGGLSICRSAVNKLQAASCAHAVCPVLYSQTLIGTDGILLPAPLPLPYALCARAHARFLQ